jgi:hypothetical protein
MRTLVSVVVLLLLGSTTAAAQVINACAKSNGALRVVAAPTDCKASETPLSWNQQGPKGDPGDMGEPGMDGAPGSDASVLRVFDREGTDLGLFVDHVPRGNPRPNSYRVFLEDSEVVVHLDIPSGDLRPRVHGIFFEEPACQGIAYVRQDGNEGRVPPGELFTNEELHVAVRYFVGERGVPIRPVTLLSNLGNQCRESSSIPPAVVPAIPVNEVSLSDLGLDVAPFPAPLYVGLPPE